MVGQRMLTLNRYLLKAKMHGSRGGRRMARLPTADLCDRHMEEIGAGKVQVVAPLFRSFGKHRSFSGQIETVKVFEDNVLVRNALEKGGGEGKVLVVDGGGSLRCALLGGNLASLGQSHGWSGIIVNGCIRDVEEIEECELGVRALASHPLKSSKNGYGSANVVVHFGGVRIAPGQWCYADSDGIIISDSPLPEL